MKALRHPDESRAYPGQALVLFALMSLVLLGMLGLAIDVGYDLAQRRSMQNIADAAALQGAAIIRRNAVTPTSTLMAEVTALARLNGLPDPDVPAATATLTCRVLDNAGADLGPCGASIPAEASGVSVRVTERHPTFVMRALGIPTSGTGADAAAHVEAVAGEAFGAGDGPFIVCGYETALAGGGTFSILQTDATGKAGNPPLIRDGATEKTYMIHGPQVATCGTQGNRFKGLNDQEANGRRPIPSAGVALKYDPGVVAGPVRAAVHGVNGCPVGATTGCVMVLPLADNVPVDCGRCQQIHAVGWAAFLVTEIGPNLHTGKLLDYALQAPGDRTWSSVQPAHLTTIRLTR